MIKKILFILSFSILLYTQAFASFWIVSDYFLFFQNKNTLEQKYVSVKTYKSRFFFDYYLLNYINWSEIWGESKLQNWKLVKIETKTDDHGNKYKSPKISHYLTGRIDIWNFWINLRNWFTWSLSDVSRLEKLTFHDLTPEENSKLYFEMFLDFFWAWFLLFLPLNIIIFFCFWYLLFSLYESYWLYFFKYVYINSFFAYLIIYTTLIYYWLSFTELASGQLFWPMNYAFLVWVPKLGLYLVSYHLFWLYHKKYPEKMTIYKYIIVWYVFLFAIIVIISGIIKRFF